MLFNITPEAGAHSFEFAFSPETAIKKSSVATTKAQGGIAIDARFSYIFPNSYFLQLGTGARFFQPSGGGSDWILYRGFNAWLLSTGAGYRFPPFALFGMYEAVPIVTLRGYGTFAVYKYTDIHYFYPGFEVEPAFEAFNLYGESVRFQAGIPVGWHFQRDLDLFVTLGLSVKMIFSF